MTDKNGGPSPSSPRRGRRSTDPQRRPKPEPRWDRDPWFDRNAPVDADSWFAGDPRMPPVRKPRPDRTATGRTGRTKPTERSKPAERTKPAERSNPTERSKPTQSSAHIRQPERPERPQPAKQARRTKSSENIRRPGRPEPVRGAVRVRPPARPPAGPPAGPVPARPVRGDRGRTSSRPALRPPAHSGKGPGERYRPRHGQPRRRRWGLGSPGRVRAFGLLGAIVLAFTGIGIKLAFIQGVDAKQYLAVGKSEWISSVTLPSDRGSILDRNGDELAMSVPQTTIYGDPHEVGKTHVVSDSQALAPILGVPQATLQSELSEDNGFVYLARTVPNAEAARVTKLDLPGIATLQEPKRFYPAGQLASALLGTVGTDDTGLGGLEYEYNSTLTGSSGKLVEETDPQGRTISGGVQEYRAPVAGNDLVLSIDEPLQYDTEQALAQAIVAAGAKSGIALLMDSNTGEILADANLTMPTAGTTTTPAVPVNIPSPTAATASATAESTKKVSQVQPVEEPSASAFTQTYEPGSVNKLITISAALQEGVIKPSDMFNIGNSYEVAGTSFHDAEVHGPKRWSVTSILANSSNIGTIQIAQRLGQSNLLKYIHAYGEGSRTDVNFPGESAGLLPSYWSGTTLPTVAFGQGIGVTAIQMLAAYNTIANGGVYVAPKLIDGIIDGQGKEHPTAASPRHRVISSTVAAEMTTMLDQVVQVGTGTAANLSPYTVAGKTGTASVPSKGGYLQGHYVASFAGFVPSEKPAITALVMINDTIDYGAAASAPTFATIARDALQELKIPPQKPQPPAPGVPIISAADATGAGEVAGTPLPGLSTPASVSPTTASPTTLTPTTLTPTTLTPATLTPTTVSPVTVSPTTVTPTTVSPVTVTPTTVSPVTVTPTTVTPTTVSPTTVPVASTAATPGSTASPAPPDQA